MKLSSQDKKHLQELKEHFAKSKGKTPLKRTIQQSNVVSPRALKAAGLTK